jgi:NCAIR mutase (PurE)-related protein
MLLQSSLPGGGRTVDQDALQSLLQNVKNGTIDVASALETLKDLPYLEMDFAKLDLHRAVRTGHAEVVFCQGKTADQAAQIVEALFGRHDVILATRATPEHASAIQALVPAAVYHERARIVLAARKPLTPRWPGSVLVLAAGTADIPVADEAALTLEAAGCAVERRFDVGVAGLHRVLYILPKLREASVIIAVAGMEGALPSVVAGLTDRPVIAVPTSVGYGANFGGLSALLTMLNSCAPGISVTNIDNGFGAAMAASRIMRMMGGSKHGE